MLDPLESPVSDSIGGLDGSGVDGFGRTAPTVVYRVMEVTVSGSIGSWTVNYLPEEGGRYTGTLEVSESGLFFDTLYESSNKTIVKAIFLDVATFTAAGGHTVYRYSNDEKAVIELPASDIGGVQGARAGMTKRAVVTMKNGEQFVFDYGMLSVKKLVAAIASISTF
jgi:hypothetical protein